MQDGSHVRDSITQCLEKAAMAEGEEIGQEIIEVFSEVSALSDEQRISSEGSFVGWTEVDRSECPQIDDMHFADCTCQVYSNKRPSAVKPETHVRIRRCFAQQRPAQSDPPLLQ